MSEETPLVRQWILLRMLSALHHGASGKEITDEMGVSDYTKKSELIDELMIGIEDKRAVFITYQSLRATEPVTYDI